MLLEALVLNKDVVRWKHHQRLSLLVLKLLRPAPLAPDPALVAEEGVEVIGEGDGRERPGTVEPGTVRVTAT